MIDDGYMRSVKSWMFSPLALTQTLPFLPLAQGDIDYQVARRGDPDLFESAVRRPRHQGHPGAGRPAGRAARSGQCRQLCLRENGALEHAAGRVRGLRPGRRTLEVVPIFLGSYGALRNEHVVALDIARMSAPGAASAIPSPTGSARARRLMPTATLPVRAAPDRLDMLEQAVERFDWVDLRGFAAPTPTPARPDRPRPRWP